jgi:predicted Zn-dependent protease with MMP-like domain
MNHKDFEKLVVDSLEDLPEVFQEKLENVEVVVEDEPTREQVRKIRASQRRTVLGLYQGVPLLRRTHFYSMVMPDKITIFKKNIERACRTNDEVRRLVIHTVQHELAHHFGISDERLRKSGTY